MQIFDVPKNRYIILIGLGLFRIEIATKKSKILSETLLDIFHNFILHKIKKIDYYLLLNGLINRLNCLCKSDPN